jgi:adenylate kinase family enzyme
MKQIVIYGPSGSGKSTLSLTLLKQGKSVFDSDFIYPMFHIKGGDPESNPEADKVWKRVVDKFIEVFEYTDGLPGVDYIFTADDRIRDYLKEKGLYVRTLSKRDKPKGERDLLSSLNGGKTP